MSFEKRVLDKVVKIYPKKYRERYAKMIIYSGVKENEQDMVRKLGSLTLLILSMFVFALLIAHFLYPAYFLWVTLGAAALSLGMVFVDYLLLYFAVEDRKERIEKVLPDFLHLIASNVRAGYTPFQALKSASRDELGPLKGELDIASTKILGSTSFKKALSDITKTVESPLVERVMHLFTTSIQAGSHIADLMEETAQDISETRGLKTDLITGTRNYQMFILFTVIIGSPLLFSISLHLVDVIGGMQLSTNAAASGSDSFGLGIMGGTMGITSGFMTGISIFMIISSSLFSAILIGVFKEGNKKYGLRYAPVIAIISLAIFMIAKELVGSMF